MPPANCCKRLTKRRLFARAAVAALEQSTLDGRHAARSSVSRSAGGVPRSPSLCLAALQSMRTSLGGRRLRYGARLSIVTLAHSGGVMTSLVQVLTLIVAGAVVALADALIKRIAVRNGVAAAFVQPSMLTVIALYLVQIACFTYVFTRHVRLGIAGNFQMVAYSVTTVAAGMVIFKERLSTLQIAGVALAVLGSVLMLREPA